MDSVQPYVMKFVSDLPLMGYGRTYNLVAKGQGTNRQTMVDKIPHRKLKIKQREPHKTDVNWKVKQLLFHWWTPSCYIVIGVYHHFNTF
jgi:hypothetical protein